MEIRKERTRSNNEIGNLREKVKNSSWPIKKKNAFINYQLFLHATGKAKRTQAIYSIHINRLGEYLPTKDYENYSEKDMIAFKTVLMEKYSPYSIHNLFLDIITFYKWLMKVEVKPLCLKWYKVGEQRRKVIKKLQAKDILTPEEIQKIIFCAGHNRNKAIISCLWETGCRIQEFLCVRIKDVNFDDKVISITIRKGKTRESEREVYLIESVPSLMAWWNEHSFKDDKNAFLFYTYSAKDFGEMLQGRTVWSLLQRSIKKAGIDKTISPHKLRHSRATFCAKKYTDQQMRKMFGWSDTSPMPSHYSSLSSDSIKESLMQDAGLLPKIENEKGMKAHNCPFCETVNTVDSLVCVKCLRPITLQGIHAIEEKKEDLKKELFQALEERILTKIKGKGLNKK